MTKDRGSDKRPSRKKPVSEPDGWVPSNRNWTPRRSGTKQIGTFVQGLTQPVFKKKPPVLARLMMDWVDFVGPRLAKQTEPRRLSAGTLTLACSGPIAMELQHLAPQIIERINVACGLRGEYEIERLKIVQDLVAFERPTPKRPKPVQIEVPDIEDEELRLALENLGGHLGARRKRR
ncbi:DUF721 domain-containing protein [Gluconobacter roseus]|uniref:DUF721 domain-containing protein n=1 Tax=Gluconobacter roseus TaxID=586239 RepID=UPI0007832529|nr:DciA family protein [Gluconobacter roseus]KXV42603.1 hypothetical protein AD943_10910 [Gluconobacter roseus]GLP92467.1 hypothetical protein GCM10007871_04450 [Gluconobacter roseus NBRC 3990]